MVTSPMLLSTDRKKQSKCLLLSAHHHINLYIHISIQYPPYSPSDAFNCWCYLKLITIIVKISFVIWLTMITRYQFLIVYHRWIKTLKQEGGGKPHPWQIKVLSNLSVIIVISFCNHFHYSTDNYLQSHCNHHHRYHHSLYSARSRTNEDISRIVAAQWLTREQKVRRRGWGTGKSYLRCPALTTLSSRSLSSLSSFSSSRSLASLLLQFPSSPESMK